MRVLVTGATGFIGQHLVPFLVRHGQQVSILVREKYQRQQELPEPLSMVHSSLNVVYADLCEYGQTDWAVQQVQPTHVFHLAAAGAVQPFLPLEKALNHNLNGTLNLVRACFEKAGSAQQLIVARTPGECSALNVYAASKAAAWTFCRMYARTRNWPIHGAVIFQAYGPGQPSRTLIPSAFRAALAGKDFSMTAGTQARDWIYVDDVVSGLASLLNAPLEPGASVDLGTGQAISVREVVEQIYALANKGGQLRPGALPNRPGEEAVQIADSHQTKTITGWQANFSLLDGLQQLHPYLQTTKQ